MLRLVKEMVIVFIGLFAAVYLVYPSLGVFELIPDAIPLVGSMDEAGATVLLVNTLNYYGINLTALYGKPDKKKRQRVMRLPPPQNDEE